MAMPPRVSLALNPGYALRFLSSVIREGRQHRPPDDTTGAQIVERGLGLAERALGDWDSRGVAGA